MADPIDVLRERAQSNSFWRWIGVEVEDAGEGWCRLHLQVRDEMLNADGAPLHGSVYAALVDMATGGALATTLEDSGGGVGQTTLDLNVSYIGSVSAGGVHAEGRILRRGRTIAFGEAKITDDDGRLLAAGRATYMILTTR